MSFTICKLSFNKTDFFKKAAARKKNKRHYIQENKDKNDSKYLTKNLLSPWINRFWLTGSWKGRWGLGLVVLEPCSFQNRKVSKIQIFRPFEPPTPLIVLDPLSEKCTCTQSFVLKFLSPPLPYPPVHPWISAPWAEGLDSLKAVHSLTSILWPTVVVTVS